MNIGAQIARAIFVVLALFGILLMVVGIGDLFFTRGGATDGFERIALYSFIVVGAILLMSGGAAYLYVGKTSAKPVGVTASKRASRIRTAATLCWILGALSIFSVLNPIGLYLGFNLGYVVLSILYFMSGYLLGKGKRAGASFALVSVGMYLLYLAVVEIYFGAHLGEWVSRIPYIGLALNTAIATLVLLSWKEQSSSNVLELPDKYSSTVDVAERAAINTSPATLETSVRAPIRIRIASLLCWACGFVVASVSFRDDFMLLLNSAMIGYSVVAVLFLVAGHVLWSARRIGVIIAGVSLAALVIVFALAKKSAEGMPGIGVIQAPVVEVVLASVAIILAATAWKGLRTRKSEASPNEALGRPHGNAN